MRRRKSSLQEDEDLKTRDDIYLAPCPFCGSTPKLVTRNVEPQNDPWYGGRVETFILCECGCCLFDGDFHEGFWDAEIRAPIAWNKRVDDKKP
ncbi:MAG: hypothetical protein CMJ58_12805 [Planctomycetaceae bacterium]|nr:hypothetical protein [Planctomycetaceae bacterium]